MAYNVTYGALQSLNIKHLFATREKTMHHKIPRQKLPVYRPEFLEFDRKSNERHKNRARIRPNVNMEFVPEYNIDVPRAPAFR
ncbi:hypothetical protein DPMN_151361 [Dreissena polymorpha]|uniref:Uncharacterized protein n=1 Tax=Dreissena polymorpha TaxID=45954 RepID=A0A9D4FHG6_DREPO|nr:hypothetical protein DPMN_151361 [Dreissena polymorpha]